MSVSQKNVTASTAAPSAANILVGTLSHTATTAAATLITVPQGRTWVGTVTLGCAIANPGGSSTAGQARGVIATAGTNVTPAAGTVLAREAKAGANVATGTVGSQAAVTGSIELVVVAPAGNAVTLTLASTVSAGSTVGVVDAAAAGQLVAV